MFVREFENAGKEEQSKNSFCGHISVSGWNIQEKKAFCTATGWKALLFANSLFLKGLVFINILQGIDRVHLRQKVPGKYIK